MDAPLALEAPSAPAVILSRCYRNPVAGHLDAGDRRPSDVRRAGAHSAVA
jgi:hypothetical protein